MATSKVLGSKPSDCFQLQTPNSWTCMNELESDVVVEVGEMSFHLHKFPLINRSGKLQRMINEFNGDNGKSCAIRLDDIPGGPGAFELVAKFCYDIKIELNAVNVVPLRCAAEHLQMTEDFVEANLITQSEIFLKDVLGNWNSSMRALQACEGVLPHAEELQIVARCIDSLAKKACADPTLFGWPMLEHYTAKSLEATVLWNGISTAGKPRSPGADWWHKEVSLLKLPVYKRLISAMRSKGMNSESIAGALMHYAKRHLSGLSRHSGYSDSSVRSNAGPSGSVLPEGDQRALLEEVVEMLPSEKGVATTRFLLGLLRTATILHAGQSCRDSLERRVGSQLDEATLEDLLIPNVEYSAETLYDVDCAQRILEQFMLANQVVAASPEIMDDGQLISSSAAELVPISTVAKLVDGYLAEVGSDANLKFTKFLAIAAAVPEYARSLDDGLYRAIDIYLKSHPWLTDSEREQLCRLMNCQKLSLEACTHAAQNERLPLRVIVQVLFFEQLRLRTTVAGWFFVSDNVDDTSHGCRKSNGEGDQEGLGLPMQRTQAALPVTSNGEEEEQYSQLSMEEIKQKVSEREEECSSMRQEIHRLGRPKGPWSSLFRKLGFGARSRQQANAS